MYAANSGRNGAKTRSAGARSAPCAPFVSSFPSGSANTNITTAATVPATNAGTMPASIA